ncbi:hypothetical protein [Mycoplasmopsis iners]|uniref:hypothetical protein n=1 Tax=Mycoplasmopsis iners TaxID=76630 RepID=UPI000495E4C0|nr:hypothetical protein [Mycoplasmopsis iners]
MISYFTKVYQSADLKSISTDKDYTWIYIFTTILFLSCLVVAIVLSLYLTKYKKHWRQARIDVINSQRNKKAISEQTYKDSLKYIFMILAIVIIAITAFAAIATNCGFLIYQFIFH